MFALDQTLVLTATDLADDCEFGLLSQAAEVRERGRKARGGGPRGGGGRKREPDPIGARIGALTRARRDEAGQRLLAGSGPRSQVDRGVTRIRRGGWSLAGQRAWHEQTLAALRAGEPIIAAGGQFVRSPTRPGSFALQLAADFLEATGSGYRVHLVTAARRTRTKDVVRAGAVADALSASGIHVADTLVVDSMGGVTVHETGDARFVAQDRRRRLEALVASEVLPEWGDDRWWACGYCRHCRAAIEPARDVRLVWGLRRHHRAHLVRAGLSTIDGLAASSGAVLGLADTDVRRLRGQARMQLRQERAEAAGEDVTVFAEVHSPRVLERLPEPDPGDLFFDFEGDPWRREGDAWGLEYLFGLIEADTDDYVTFWAHSLAEERQALEAFLDYLRDRRRVHPGLHVYHYAFYEPETLRRLAARHEVGAAEVEELLAEGVFVDLYEVVKGGVHVSQRSFSLKKLEPLYMGSQLRDDAGVTDGAASIVAYEEAAQARGSGDERGWQAGLKNLADYNAYDCLSTRRLRDWLLDQRARGEGATTSEPVDGTTGTDTAITRSGEGAAGQRVVPAGSVAEELAVKRVGEPAAMPPAFTICDYLRGASGSAVESMERPGAEVAGTVGTEGAEDQPPAGTGVRPALTVVTVVHRGRREDAPEEAQETLARIQALVTAGVSGEDVLVVAFTEGQVELLRELLAGTGARVGTPSGLRDVDGRVVVVDAVASTLADAAGGAGDLLDREAWSTALTRGSEAVIVVRSDQLLATLPRSAEAFGDYAALLRLLGG